MSPRTAQKVDIETIREQILDSASERFQQFGYGKTTMAEIASDCEMSASNLYRFFENKQDIGAALAAGCLMTRAEHLGMVVAQSDRGAAERLEEYIQIMLHHTHQQCSTAPRMVELVDHICEHRPDLVMDHQQDMTSLMSELLQQGVASGEFEIVDIEAVAKAILTATVVFEVPHFMSLHTLKEFETLASNLSHLLVCGLQKRT